MIEIQLPEGARIRGDHSTDTTLADLDPGQVGIVRAVLGEEEPRRRLLEMGFVSGTPLRVVRLAPFGDPMEVELHGYHLSLRKAEAREVLVHPAES